MNLKNKAFHVGDPVYTFGDFDNGNAVVLYCHVVGVSPFHTSTSEWAYYVEDPYGQILWRLPSDMWEGLEALKTALEGRVVGGHDEIH